MSTENDQSSDILAWIGTYTAGADADGRSSEGIYACRFSPADGTLSLLGATSGIDNPSFLCTAPGGGFLYAVCEVSECDGAPGGAVAVQSSVPETATGRPIIGRRFAVVASPC